MQLKFPNLKILGLDGLILLLTALLGVATRFLFAGISSSFLSLSFANYEIIILFFAITFFVTSFFIVFSLVQKDLLARLLIFLVSAVLFSFFTPSFVPIGGRGIVGLIFLLGLLLLDYAAYRAKSMYTFFGARIFGGAISRFTFLLILSLSFMFFFSPLNQKTSGAVLPTKVLDPIFDIVVERLIERVAKDVGAESLPDEEKLAALKEAGLFLVIEQQFGIKLDPTQIKTLPQLIFAVRQPLAKDLQNQIDKFIAPYRRFIPLISAFILALTLSIVLPLASPLGVFILFLVYKTGLLLKILKFEYISKEIPQLAIK